MALMGSAVAAHAANYPGAVTPTGTYDLGELSPQVDKTSPTFVVDGTQKKTTATYDFSFSLANTYGTSATGSFTVVPQFSENFSDAQLELFSGTPANFSSATALDLVDFNPSKKDEARTLADILNPGNYFVQATVTVPKGDTGPFTVAATVKSISKAPEPSTWLLMMLGVGGLGLALRRRLGAGLLANA